MQREWDDIASNRNNETTGVRGTAPVTEEELQAVEYVHLVSHIQLYKARGFLVSAGHLCDLSVFFMDIQNLVTLFMILCESCGGHDYDVRIWTSQKWRHIETMFADTIILWISI